jgi:hypothetical protein
MARTRATADRRAPRPGRVLGVELDDVGFLRPTRRRAIPPGAVLEDSIEVPEAAAQRLLQSIIRFVADVPAESTPGVVWQLGRNELLVRTDTVTVACTSGLVRIGYDVECDEVGQSITVTVPIAVGTTAAPTGLVMSTFSRVDGPAVVTAVWSEAIAAFAWEALLELARRLSAELGRDERGRPLIPVAVGAAPRLLIVTAMARHDTSTRVLR